MNNKSLLFPSFRPSQVHVVLSDNRPLGLMIRGGNEFGLGIYITSIDVGQVAENAGLKVSKVFLIKL